MDDDNKGGEGETKFIEVDGNKFVDDGAGQPKKGEDGNPIPFVEKKSEPSPEDVKNRLDRELSRHKEKYPNLYENDGSKKPEKKEKGKKSEDLDYGQKAFLIAKGIEEAEDIALVKQIMEDTGKSLEDVIATKYLQSELKERKDQRLLEKAIPNKGNRNGQSAANAVDYWIAKGGLPENTPENTQLRRDIVNARAKKEKSGDMFTSNPVVGNPG